MNRRYFDKIKFFVYTPGVEEIPNSLKLRILEEVIKLPYEKNYLQVLSLRKIGDLKLELVIEQEEMNKDIKARKAKIQFEISKSLYEDLNNYNKLFLVEEGYYKKQIVQTMLLAEEY